VLKDDGHLLRILRAQPVRDAHAHRARVEGDVEMMISRQALFGRLGQYAAHHAAQGLLGQKIVADVVGHADVGDACARLESADARAFPGEVETGSPSGNAINQKCGAVAGESHPRNCVAVKNGIRAGKVKWRLLLPGASEPRLTAAKTARA